MCNLICYISKIRYSRISKIDRIRIVTEEYKENFLRITKDFTDYFTVKSFLFIDKNQQFEYFNYYAFQYRLSLSLFFLLEKQFIYRSYALNLNWSYDSSCDRRFNHWWNHEEFWEGLKYFLNTQLIADNRFSPGSHRRSTSRISSRMSARRKENIRHRSRRKTCKLPAASTRPYRCSLKSPLLPVSPRNCHRHCRM